MNGTLGKFAWLLAPDHKRAEDSVCADQWHNEARSIAGLYSDFSQRAWRLVTYIGGLLRLFVSGCLVDRIRSAEVLVLDCCDQFFAQTVGCPQPEELLRLVKNVNGTGFRVRKLDRLGDDRGQHRLQIKGGV